MWGALAVSMMCSIQSGRRANAADTASDAANAADDDDVDGWLAESIARAQHCFATAHRLDPKNIDNLCNYAVFSSEIAGDASRAKGAAFPWILTPPLPPLFLMIQHSRPATELFASALKCDANHAETLLNFANFLDGQGDHEQGAVPCFVNRPPLIKLRSHALAAIRRCSAPQSLANEWCAVIV